MDANVAFTAAMELLLLLLSISIHECCHALAAERMGDPTGRMVGRVSLNPFRHMDPLGSVFLPGLLLALGLPVFGWGRPTPIVDDNVKPGGLLGAWPHLAGPAANFFLAALATLSLPLAVHLLGPSAREVGMQVLTRLPGPAVDTSGFPVMFTLIRMATLNAFLGVFNLIPLPPLDGGKVALRLLPPDWAAKLVGFHPYSFLIGIVPGMAAAVLLLVPFHGLLIAVINIL